MARRVPDHRKERGACLELNSIETEIRKVLGSELRVKKEVVERLTSETALLGNGVGLDSMEALTLVTALENRFSIQVDDQELTRELFRNLGTLAAFVADKLSR